MPTSTSRLWAGVDLGGTGTRVTVVDDSGTAAAASTVPTSTFDRDPARQLADLVTTLLPAGRELAGVGIGASGPVDLTSGRIDNPDTLPQFTGLDVAGDLAERLGIPTWIDNDAVVAGLAENTWGAAASAPSALCITLGTGIGAAMIQNDSPIRAADGQHPEGGHIPVPGSGHPCYCGLPQCWEQVASRSALDRLRLNLEVSERRLWSTYARHLASGLITLLTLYRPHTVVIGGSVAQHWDALEQPLREALAPFRDFTTQTRLVPSALGDHAGAIGATLLARRGIGWHP